MSSNQGFVNLTPEHKKYTEVTIVLKLLLTLYSYIVTYPKRVSVIHISGRRSLVSVSEVDTEDNSVSCVTCMSCQQAASGTPKCTICDRVCHAIILCIAATDDDNVLEHMTSAFDAREQQRGANRKQLCFSLYVQ